MPIQYSTYILYLHVQDGSVRAAGGPILFGTLHKYMGDKEDNEDGEDEDKDDDKDVEKDKDAEEEDGKDAGEDKDKEEDEDKDEEKEEEEGSMETETGPAGDGGETENMETE